jgi:hypothetical protein
VIANPSTTESERVARPAAPRTELWVKLSYGLLGLALALVIYLGLRREGVLPVRIWLVGPIVLGLASIALALFGVAWSAVHRPFVTRPRVLGLFALALVVGGITLPFPFPSRHEGHPSLVRFRLPVRGEWTVVWGGDDPSNNLLAKMRADRRWGLDLLVVRDGKTCSGNSLFESFAFDQPVEAPCAGTVVLTKDIYADHPGGRVADDAVDELGNLIVLEVAPGEFLFLCNLRSGSLRVAVGDKVETGAELARVGNSGASRFTPEPHLALHLQDTAVPSLGQPIPWRFYDYESNGVAVESGLPKGGVSARPDGAGPTFTGERIRRRE